MRISDWSSDVCSSDLPAQRPGFFAEAVERASQLAEAAVRLPHPARQYVEIARDARRRRPLDDEAEIAPSILGPRPEIIVRSEEHTSELQSLMRTSYAVFCLKKKITSTHSCYHIITSINIRYTDLVTPRTKHKII